MSSNKRVAAFANLVIFVPPKTAARTHLYAGGITPISRAEPMENMLLLRTTLRLQHMLGEAESPSRSARKALNFLRAFHQPARCGACVSVRRSGEEAGLSSADRKHEQVGCGAVVPQ